MCFWLPGSFLCLLPAKPNVLPLVRICLNHKVKVVIKLGQVLSSCVKLCGVVSSGAKRLLSCMECLPSLWSCVKLCEVVSSRVESCQSCVRLCQVVLGCVRLCWVVWSCVTFCHASSCVKCVKLKLTCKLWFLDIWNSVEIKCKSCPRAFEKNVN